MEPTHRERTRAANKKHGGDDTYNEWHFWKGQLRSRLPCAFRSGGPAPRRRLRARLQRSDRRSGSRDEFRAGLVPWRHRNSALLLGDPVERVQKKLDVASEPAVGQFNRIPSCQAGKAAGQFIKIRHPGTPDQGRNDSDIACQRGFDLEPHKVLRIVQTPAAGRRCVKPVGTDESDEHVAVADGPADHLSVVGTRLDSVDVHEHCVAAESSH